MAKRSGNIVILVIWVVLMMFWLFGGSYYVYNSPNQNLVVYGTNTFIPWCCVLILGLFQFGAFNKVTPVG